MTPIPADSDRRVPRRRVVALLGPLVLAAALLGVPSAAVAREAPGPIHAGNTFGWYGHGGLVYDETFVGPLASRWKVAGPGVVRNQHGMLTLNSRNQGTVSATLERPGQAYGRWETRIRSRAYGRKGARFRVLTELVPVSDSKERCGELNIGLGRFRPGGTTLDLYARSRPGSVYGTSIERRFAPDQWHTLAVEVTPSRISWFVDSAVIRSETRDDALTGTKYQVRFTMQAAGEQKMRRARMQMDWLRYWSLKAKNERSTRAPLTTVEDYPRACPPA